VSCVHRNPETGLLRWIEQHKVTERIVFLRSVPEAKLPSLYRGATAMVFPSLYEGFALPVLEAMACGTSVVTSNVTAMPETAGGAALLVNPGSVEEIAHAIERITEDRALREQLSQRDLVRAAQFPWSNTCERVHTLLASLGSNRRDMQFEGCRHVA
jgi:glycosyltransferase involved in cell wall biosynthesis